MFKVTQLGTELVSGSRDHEQRRQVKSIFKARTQTLNRVRKEGGLKAAELGHSSVVEGVST